MKDKRSALGVFAAVVVALVVWWGQSGGLLHDSSGGAGPTVASSPSGGSTTGSEAGLRTIAVADLPAEAQHTLDLIDSGGPFRYEQDGAVFGNFEGILPAHQRGYYREYTVETPGSPDRGARRIVVGDGDSFYYTDDHYSSFSRILR